MFEQLQQIDSLQLNFNAGTQHIVNVILAFIMFGVSLGIKLENFKKIVLNPKSVIRGVIAQFLLLPALTFLLVFALKSYITPTVALGMILVAACPGGNISNFISSISRGNTELSVSLTAIATVAAVFMTPLNFTFWGNLFASSSDLVQPIKIPLGQVFQTILILLGIPLVAGMMFAWKLPKTTQKIRKPIQIISIIIFFGLVVGAFAANFNFFVKYIKYIFFIVLAHNALALLTGYFFSTATLAPKKDRRTITIETGIQNSGLALVLMLNPKIFPPEMQIGGMMFIAAWWGVWHIISGLGISFVWTYVAKNLITNRRKRLSIKRTKKNI